MKQDRRNWLNETRCGNHLNFDLSPPPHQKKLVDEIKWKGWNSRFCWLDAAGGGGGGREWLLQCGWLVGSCHLPFPCDGAWRAWCSRWRARLKSLRRRCCCCWPVGRRSAAGVACYTRTSLFNYLSFTRHRRKMQRAAQELAAHNQNEFFLSTNNLSCLFAGTTAGSHFRPAHRLPPTKEWKEKNIQETSEFMSVHFVF